MVKMQQKNKKKEDKNGSKIKIFSRQQKENFVIVWQFGVRKQK